MTVLIGHQTDNGDLVGTGNQAGEIRVTRMTALASGDSQSVTIKLGTITAEMRIVVYDVAGGSPGDLLGWIPVPSSTPVDEEATLTFTGVSFVQGQDYWIGTQISDTGGFIYRDTSASSLDLNFDTSSAYGAAPNDPFVKASGIFSTPRLLYFSDAAGGPAPELRKGGSTTIDKPAGIGTITGVTLNGNTITLDSQTVDDFTVTDSDGTITTSGTYDLVATGDTVETISVQVNVYGVAPSNNPVQKDGAAQASLTGVELRVTAGANLNGSELYYTATATTDASGNLSSIDLSSTAAADADPVVLTMRTAAGDSITSDETVGLI